MPHIKHLYPVKNVSAFIKDLDYLLKFYTPISYQEFSGLSKSNKQVHKPSFLLSFDDGLSEFHDVIAPILLKKGIPAICFLNPHFIDNKDLFFRYKSSLIIDKLEKEPHLNKMVQKRFNSSKKTGNRLLEIDYQNREVLNQIAENIHLSFSDFLSEKSPYLTSDQIKSLINKGFHFGAHSLDHPKYEEISLQEQIRQTRESINFVCTNFAIDYKIFSFPFTDYSVSKTYFNRITKENIAEHTFGSAGQKKDIAAQNYQRIPFEMNKLSGQQILKSELLFYCLKMPLGKNLIHRHD